jgi:hypothetical protein
MAARKRPPEPQGALSLFAPAAPVVEIRVPHVETMSPDVKPAQNAVVTFGEPEPAATPKLRLAYSRPDEDVEIEREPRGGWWVQRRRKNGTIFAAVHYTRGELALLRERIDATLEAG